MEKFCNVLFAEASLFSHEEIDDYGVFKLSQKGHKIKPLKMLNWKAVYLAIRVLSYKELFQTVYLSECLIVIIRIWWDLL